MKRIALLTFGLWVSLAGGMGAAILVGRTVPVPVNVKAIGFDRCGDTPCFLEILPGRTSWVDAQETVARLADSNVWDKRLTVRSTVGSEASIYPSYTGETTGRVYITPSRSAPLPVGWIVQRYGAPCAVSIYYETGIMTLRYPNLLANVRIADNYLGLYAPVMQLQLTDPTFFAMIQPNQCVDKLTGWRMENRSWQGFASARHYLSHTP